MILEYFCKTREAYRTVDYRNESEQEWDGNEKNIKK